ncbi:MAG: EamA family transporter [Acidimicrobiaceae bacterium]|nr:EamA family transporter [Acidimicrobiaceae bacterium]
MSSSAPGVSIAGAGFIILGATSIQWSAAIVQPVLERLGPVATSGWRFLVGSIILMGATRPHLRQWRREQWRSAIILGVTLAFMSVSFYQAIARIPLGSAVTIEFLGPLSVAVFGHRSWRHFSFAFLAAIGVVLLAHPGGGVTFTGAIFALLSGLGWGVYVFAAARLGGATTGFGGLAVSMSVSALVTLPWALSKMPLVLHHPTLGGRLFIVGFMSIVLGFASEFQALRRLSPAAAGVLMSLDPAIAFAIGALILHERATTWVLVGLVCVVMAGAGVTMDRSAPEETLTL